MPTYKLLTDAYLGGKIQTRGTIVDLSEDEAAPYLERGTIGDKDAEIDERNAFQKAQDEGTEEGRLVEETQARESQAQAEARAEIESARAQPEGGSEDTAPLAPTPAGSELDPNPPATPPVSPNPPAPAAGQPSPADIDQTLASLNEPPAGSTPPPAS